MIFFRGMNNFLMWKLTLKMVPFLSDEFRKVYELFQNSLTGKLLCWQLLEFQNWKVHLIYQFLIIPGAQKPVQRWELCTELLVDHFDHAMGVEYSRNVDNFAEKDAAVSFGTRISKFKLIFILTLVFVFQVKDLFEKLRSRLLSVVASTPFLSEDLKTRTVEKVRFNFKYFYNIIFQFFFTIQKS